MKKQLIFIFAAIFVVASAFTVIKKDASAKRTTYFYVMDSGGEPLDESDYGDALEFAPSACEGKVTVCWIEAEDNGIGGPDILGTSLEDEILDALDDDEDKPHVKLRY